MSHAHYAEEYSEEKGRAGYRCRVVLRFNEPELPQIDGKGEGRSKK